MITLGIAIGFAVFIMLVATRSFYRVEQGHLAVLTAFGAAKRDPADEHRLKTHGPGLHRKLPWEKVHDVSMMEQNLDLSGEEGGRTAMAEDGTVLRLDSILRYVPVESELSQFLFGLRSPLEHITGAFTCLLRNEIANFRAPMDTIPPSGTRALVPFETREGAGSYALIRRERQQLNEKIERFCRTRIGNRYGVKFNAVDLTDILPPDELADALNAVMNAQTEADAHYAHAESDCAQRVLASEQGVAIAKARAQAVETEIVGLAGYLQGLANEGTLDMYVTRRRAETLSESRALFMKRDK